MQKKIIFVFTSLILSACSIYSSAGRKQFEAAAPTQVQTFSLLSCRDMGTAETWVRNEFPSANSELVELTEDYEVWKKPQENGQIEVTVLAKHEDNSTQSCTYEFDSEDLWKKSQQKFLKELSNSLAIED